MIHSVVVNLTDRSLWIELSLYFINIKVKAQIPRPSICHLLGPQTGWIVEYFMLLAHYITLELNTLMLGHILFHIATSSVIFDHCFVTWVGVTGMEQSWFLYLKWEPIPRPFIYDLFWPRTVWVVEYFIVIGRLHYNIVQRINLGSDSISNCKIESYFELLLHDLRGCTCEWMLTGFTFRSRLL